MAGLFRRLWDAYQNVRPAPVPGVALPATTTAARYLISTTDRELRQGEIISGLTRYIFEPDPDVPGQIKTFGVPVLYSVIATPDCDLLQSFRALRDSKPERINGVFFFEAEEAELSRKRIPINSSEWRHVSRNRVEGYHLLSGFTPETDMLGEQIPDLLIDFKRYFILPTAEVYRQCREGAEPKASRRCCLGNLWREDVQQRAMSFMQRVGTPDPADER